MQNDLETITGDLPDREDAVTKAEAALEDREAAVKKSEQAVASAEKAVSPACTRPRG